MDDECQSTANWIEEAMGRYERPLIRYAAHITGDVEQARDVVQDTFLRLCTADRRSVQGRLAAWLYTVCRNRAFDVRKKERRMEPLNDAEADAQAGDCAVPAAVAARSEVHGLVLEALNLLSRPQQEAFRLKFQDDLTYREISEVMGKSLGAVSNLITAGLDTVRQRLQSKLDLAEEMRS